MAALDVIDDGGVAELSIPCFTVPCFTVHSILSVTATVIVTVTVTMAGQHSLASMQAACKDAASNNDSLVLSYGNL